MHNESRKQVQMDGADYAPGRLDHDRRVCKHLEFLSVAFPNVLQVHRARLLSIVVTAASDRGTGTGSPAGR